MIKQLYISLLAVLMLSGAAAAESADTKTLQQLKDDAAKQTEAAVPYYQNGSAFLKAPFQAMEAQVSSDGLSLHSLAAEEAGQFQLKPVAFGKAQQVEISPGTVAIVGDKIHLRRNGLSEIFSSSMDGIRQDFLVHQKPAGQGALSLELAVEGAEVSGQGQQVQLVTAAGRALVYNNLHITDAHGKVLTGQMLAVNKHTLRITIDDHDAHYPLLIDPTYTDADWQVLNEGLSGANYPVKAFAVWDNRLYIGGFFTGIGNVQANYIASWNGTAWSALGAGMSGIVTALTVFDGKLIAGGGFTTAGGAVANRIASWDGATWSALGDGMNGNVTALTVFDGKLIAGGDFYTAGGTAATYIASWSGTAWSALGDGMSSSVYALTVFDGTLIAGGAFTTAGGTSANRIASWSGTAWSALGSGINGVVTALTVFNDTLIAGGSFTTAGGTSANRIASWSGTAWSALGSGMNGNVTALTVFDGKLIAGGDFYTAGGTAATYIASWSGTAWSALGDGMSSSVYALTVFDGTLIAGGAFTTAGGTSANRIASWSGTAWSALGAGMNSNVTALTVFNDMLIAGGLFTTTDDTAAKYIASWNGTTWSALDTGMSNVVTALTVFDGKLIAAGYFTTAGDTAANYIASWDGAAWSALGDGMNNTVKALTVFDGKLIAGGDFYTAGGTIVNRIASWDGTAWSALGSGMIGSVNALTVFDGQLIAGGTFSRAGGTIVTRIASWDGAAWSALGSGMNSTVNALTVFDGKLIAGGDFSRAGGTTVNRIASWSGTAWSALGSGMIGSVYALTVFDDKLIAGGGFETAGGTAANRIASWDGAAWSALGSGMNSSVTALTVFNGALIAGGGFSTAGDKYSPYIAQLGSCICSITFDSAGGSAVDSITASYGTAVTAPSDPTREGYTFAGWTPSLPSTMPAANTTVTAQWTANNYSITFDSAGGSAVDSITASYGTAVTAPSDPTREGYTFAGWTPSLPSTMPATNTTVTAQWTINAYTITFDAAGGSAVAPISANFGAAITAPANPTRESYTFAGWTPSLPSTMPAANATVTAQWTANNYSITFDSAGGSAVAPISANFGAAITAPANPTREGYTFAGWTPSVPTTMPAANTTVTAQWTVNAYTLTFDSAGGAAVAPISANFGAAVTVPVAPIREGYTFAGWTPSVPTTMPAANTTVTAQWTVNAYTLTFDSAGGSAVAPISADFGAAVTVPVAPIREGYTFAGWTPSVPTTMPAANTTVTAQWTVNAYTLTFDSAGGSAVAPISADFGAVVTAPANPTREGFTFMGWEPAIPATMPAQNLTLTAQYEQIQLTVTATVTGEATISPTTQQVNYGSTATVELRLVNADDIVVLGGTCQAAVSGNQILTSRITEACTIVVTVYPFTQVEKDTDAALASNGTSRFSFSSGAGSKTLLGARLIRAGIESEVELAEAEALLTLQDDGSYVFSAQRTGRYTLEFVDAVSGELVQVVYNVFPHLAFTSSQQPVQRDVATNVRVWLSDEPVDYPVTVAVVKDGVTAEVQTIEFTAEHKLLRTYAVTATAGTARLILQEAGITNALLGTPAVHNLAIQQQAPALAFTAKAAQNASETHVVTQTAGVVTLSVSELNATEATYSWTASGITLNASGATASFDPSTLAEGRYTITVTGQSANGRTGQYDLALRVIAVCPVESCAGAGSSGIPAAQNNVADTPNRLPLCPNVAAENRVGSCQTEGAQALYAEVPNQYQLALGALTEQQSWSSGQFGIALNDRTLTDAGFVQQGLAINFDVLGLESPGEVVPVAIPLTAGLDIPANAVWRKFINGQWQNFVVDSANRIDSAARDVLGQCPGVSSDVWTSGLTSGHGCVRLTIQDGGPNDDDGVANSVIRDPGVLAVAEVVIPPAPIPVPSKDVAVKSGGSMGGAVTLLLTGLAAFRLRKVWATAVLLPLTVSAQDLYLGADLMSVGSDTSSAEVTDAMNGKGIAGTAFVDDKTRAGFRLYGGYQFAETVSIEFGWLDAGEVTTSFSNVAPDTVASDLESVWPTSGEGVELSLLLQPITVAELFKPGLRLGVWQMEVKDKFFDSADLSRQSQSETVPFAELQGQLKLNANWSLKMGVSYYDVESADLRTAQLGLIRRF